MDNIKFISGGVTAPSGFRAGGMHVGVKTRDPNKRDLAIIASSGICTAAAVYTKNIVKAAPLSVTKRHLRDGALQAVIVNSGNANACAPNGEAHAERMCAAAAAALGISAENVAVASTGVIGQELPIEKIEKAAPQLAGMLSIDGSGEAAAAIMTTDTVKKEYAVCFELQGKRVTIGGIAKGSGMIHPNMGTMLAFFTTDIAISQALLQDALLCAAQKSFNRISVDGDTSTNDMAIIMASGLAGNRSISERDSGYAVFYGALLALCERLAREMASDGEGAQHLITCTVSNAASDESAEIIAKSVISSTLFKAAVFGCDANWGRILCAMGYSGEEFDPDCVDVSFRSAAGEIAVCNNGRGVSFSEENAKAILSEHDIEVLIDMHQSGGSATCWGCDITYDYIKINGDYRT